MPHRRHTITVASSALLFVCLMLHAQGRLYAQTPAPYSDAEAFGPEDESVALLQPLFDSFVALNKTSWQSQPDFSLSPSYEPVSREDLQAFFKTDGGGWEALAKRSGFSYSMLSPVAFHADATMVVDYMGHDCGGCCGEGLFPVPEKKEGIWKNLRWKGTSRAWAS